MNIVFFGTSEFAVPSLNKLIASSHKVLAVATQPDRKKGRDLKISSSPVKEVAVENKLLVLQPEKFEENFIKKLKSFKPDLFIVIAYGHILKKEILDIPKYYSINLHASLLPEYRGAAPINWAIIKGEARTGVTIIRMNENMDEGDIISQREARIEPNDTFVTLSGKLSRIGSDLLIETLGDVEGGRERFIKQDNKYATYARRLTKEDGLIDWNESAVKIHNKVRALVPWPGAYAKFKGKILKIWQTKVVDNETGKAGMVIKALGADLVIGTGEGLLKVLELQIEGSRIMDAASFMRGHTIKAGEENFT